jgi:hypothetical protein
MLINRTPFTKFRNAFARFFFSFSTDDFFIFRRFYFIFTCTFSNIISLPDTFIWIFDAARLFFFLIFYNKFYLSSYFHIYFFPLFDSKCSEVMLYKGGGMGRMGGES